MKKEVKLIKVNGEYYCVSNDEIKEVDTYLYWIDGKIEIMVCQDDFEADICNNHPMISPYCKKVILDKDQIGLISVPGKDLRMPISIEQFQKILDNDGKCFVEMEQISKSSKFGFNMGAMASDVEWEVKTINGKVIISLKD